MKTFAAPNPTFRQPLFLGLFSGATCAMVNAQVATSLTRKCRVTSVASCVFFQWQRQGERASIKNIYRQGLRSPSAWIKSGLSNPKQ
jgi:hypothetical protein